jgi:DeoR family transcriptional regulator of aga operon
MLSLIEEREFMRVVDLSTIFAISEVTVRSDLDQLASSSLVERVHGGAMLRPGAAGTAEPSFEQSEATSADEKAAIGAAAAKLVSPGESLVIDVGTTTTAVARALAQRTDLDDVVIFTNGLTIAMELESAIPRFTVILTGGTLRPRQHSLVDPMAGMILDETNVAMAIIGCNGIHRDEGVTNVNLPEAAVKRRMVTAAQRVVVVAGGSKLGKISVTRFARISDVDALVTGSSAPPELVSEFRDLGINTTVAE